jgi:hypothetical protein
VRARPCQARCSCQQDVKAKPYQMEQRSCGAMTVPAGRANAEAKAGRALSAPLTRKRGGECGSTAAKVRSISGRRLVHHDWASARKRLAPEPMLDFDLFRNRNFVVGNLATVAIYAGLGASTFMLTIFLQQVVGYAPIMAGLARRAADRRRLGERRAAPRWCAGAPKSVVRDVWFNPETIGCRATGSRRGRVAVPVQGR